MLTEREKGILTLLAGGATNKEIALRLHISVHTVKAHLETIFAKLNVSNRVQAAIKGVVLGYIDINALA